MKIILISLFLLSVGSSAAALDEHGLAKSYDSVALPYFESSTSLELTAKDGVKLHYRYFPASGVSKGTIVIVNGRTEFMPKYAELVYDLRDSGYSIFLYDHRGQGESQRVIPDQPFKGHVDKYQDYVDDLAQFMSEVVRPGSSGDIYMITHSMGGAVATAYLEQNPGAVKALVAASPMYEPALPLHIPQEIALGILESAIALGEGKNYAPGKGENDWNVPFEDNDVTTSEARYNYAHEDWIRHPELIIAGPTNQWVAEAIKIGMYDRDHAEALKQTRTLILQAGLDSVVDTDANDVFARSADAKILYFPNAKHEILMEQDEIRNAAIRVMLDFLRSVSLSS